MKKFIAVLLLACMLITPISASADGLLGNLGDLVGGVFGGNQFENEDFDAKMKAIEGFFDDYIAFMKKYNKNPQDLALISQYGTMLESYGEAMQALDSIDEDKLTDKEHKTYLKTLDRINKKLLKAGLSMG